jgi:tRNA 2-thiouridine synthesizing protein C
MTSPTLIHVTTPPSPDCEALEYALALAAFDLEVAILFTGDGLFWLQPNQEARTNGGKSPSKLLAALPMFGIDQVGYSVANDKSNHLKLITGANRLDQKTRLQWVSSASHIVSF